MSGWCLDPDVAYLSHGAFGAVPRVVADAAEALREQIEANPMDELVRRLPGRVDAIRQRVAAFLNADAAGCVFMPNATTGTATVLAALAPTFEPGDEILTTDHRYVAVGTQLAAVAASRGTSTVVADVPLSVRTVDEVVEAIVSRVTARTRLLVVDSIASPTGFVFPVREIVAAAHDRGVPVLVDGAHAPGQIEVDVEAIGADFWVGNLHKWVNCLRAVAVLHVRKPWQQSVRPLVASHGYAESFHAAFQWVGTHDPVPMLSVPAAMDFWEAIGWTAVRRTQRSLVDVGADVVARALGTSAPVGPPFRAAMRIVELPERLDHDTALALESALSVHHGVEISVTGLGETSYVRVCGQVYNDADDFERLAKALPLVLDQL